MAKKLIFALLLSLLVSVQALSASCDIRCSSMRTSTDCHYMQAAGPMAHCHGHALKSSDKTCFTSNDSCASSPCRTDLTATNKSTSQNDADSSKLLLSAIALPIDPFQSVAPRSTPGLALAGRSDGRPLAQRPGSSLRI
jgi:hypothetical protein